MDLRGSLCGMERKGKENEKEQSVRRDRE